MSDSSQQQLGNTLWAIADPLRGAMNADDFRDYMLAFLFLRYLSDNYEIAARKELGSDYPELEADSYLVPLSIWYELNPERIRTKLLNDGHIDTVIGLPANLFYSTGIPVCILVLKKCKKPDDVLFINAAENYEKGKRQNQLSLQHIAKIIDTYKHRTDEPRYSRRVEMSEIEKNNFNLNISRCISTATADEEIDLQAVNSELGSLEQAIADARDKHNSFLRELGLPVLP